MKNLALLSLLMTAIIVFTGFKSGKVKSDPWAKDQLMEPADLAKQLAAGNKNNIVIFSIGPSGLIKGAIDMGAAHDNGNLAKLKTALNKLPGNTNVVIYCGCCPFEHCPNIRPAFKLLNEMKFTNAKFLNLPHNLKADWIDKGYPMPA